MCNLALNTITLFCTQSMEKRHHRKFISAFINIYFQELNHNQSSKKLKWKQWHFHIMIVLLIDELSIVVPNISWFEDITWRWMLQTSWSYLLKPLMDKANKTNKIEILDTLNVSDVHEEGYAQRRPKVSQEI